MGVEGRCRTVEVDDELEEVVMLVLKGGFEGAVRELNAAVVHSDLPTMKVERVKQEGNGAGWQCCALSSLLITHLVQV